MGWTEIHGAEGRAKRVAATGNREGEGRWHSGGMDDRARTNNPMQGSGTTVTGTGATQWCAD